MKTKKIVALLMAMLLILSVLAACGSGTSTSGTSEESKSEGSAASGENAGDADTDDIMTPYGRYPELIEVHTAKRQSVAPNFLEGDDVENNPMSRYIEDRINVRTIVDWEVETTEFANKLSLMLASDDIPDMFSLTSNDYLLYKQLVDNNMLADQSEAFEKCAGEFMTACFDTFKNKNLEPFREGDALYAIAGGRYGYEHNQLWLRKDWMEKSGITEMPETLEDIENILTVWKENPPVDDYVGMALNAQDVAGGYGSSLSADPIFNMLGAAPKTWVRDENGEIVYGSTLPEVKEGLAIIRDWYEKGLIDPQFATRTATDATKALFTGGQTGLIFAPWWFGYSCNEMPKNFPDLDIAIINAPIDEEGKYNILWPGPSGDFIVINAEYEHPEVAVKLINCEFDMWRGFDKDAYDVLKETRDNNVDWSYMFPTSGVNLEYSNCVPEVGTMAKNLIEEGKMECNDPMYSSIPSVQGLATYAKEYADTGSLDGMGWTEYTARYKASSPDLMYADNINIIEPVYGFVTPSMADLKPNLDTLERTTFLKIVMGELPLDAFDQFVEDWYAQGGQTMTDEVKAEVNK